MSFSHNEVAMISDHSLLHPALTTARTDQAKRMEMSGAERPTALVRRMFERRRIAFSLVEILVVIAIIAVLIGLLLPAVQKVREAAGRSACRNNLKQLGIAFHGFANENGYLPPGIITTGDLQDAYHTAYTYVLPYIEQDGVYKQYDFTSHWYDPVNYGPAAAAPPILFCPSNRGVSTINLTPYSEQWAGCAMPPFVGASDYILCKGANAGLHVDPSLIPDAARGIFNYTLFQEIPEGATTVSAGLAPQFPVTLANITDGLSSTFLIGEGAGGNSRFPIGTIKDPTQVVSAPFITGPALMDQSWSAASLNAVSMPWTAGIFGVTAQFGLPPDPIDEPMNRSPGTCSAIGGDPSGYNLSGRDRVSGFRSVHPNGAQFLFADGSVQFVPQTIDPAVYRALSTYTGGEANTSY